MKKETISNAITNIDAEYVEKAADYAVIKTSKKIGWYKWVSAACFVVAILVVIGFIGNPWISNQGEYKRINISAPALGELDNTLSKSTKIEYNAKESFAETMPIYQITPRQVTEEEFMEFAETFGAVGGYINHIDNGVWTYDTTRNLFARYEKNEISFQNSTSCKTAITKSDEELKAEAKVIFEKIKLLEGEYECLGVTSIRTKNPGEEDECISEIRISFRRILNGARIIGNDICDIYFNAQGVNSIELHLYDYEVIGEMDMVPLETAKSKIKNPDALGTYEIEGKPKLTDTAEKLTVERVKLIYVNQYGDGCTILQPVYNFIGTATNGEECMEFQSKVIAIPDKYTYTE